ncbi:MAG: hypothetical protein ACREHC_04560 [Candidatus Levyibacteriota bacterium]
MFDIIGATLNQAERGIHGDAAENISDRVHTRALRIALTIARDYVPLGTHLKPVRSRAPSITYISESPDPRYNIALRLITSNDIPTLLKRTTTDVNLLMTLHSKGAQVEEYLDNPREKNGFVVTVKRRLPRDDVSYIDYGKALASLHNAGRNPEIQKKMHGAYVKP